MNKTVSCLPFLLLVASAAHAQTAPGCPQLPAGRPPSPRSPFEPKRGNREEAGTVDGREVQWYRAELVTKPDIEARETLIELDDGRVAHIWLQAPSGEQLRNALDLTRRMS